MQINDSRAKSKRLFRLLRLIHLMSPLLLTMSTVLPVGAVTNSYLEEALTAYEKADYRSAARLFSDVLLKDPHSTVARKHIQYMTAITSVPMELRLELMLLNDSLEARPRTAAKPEKLLKQPPLRQETTAALPNVRPPDVSANPVRQYETEVIPLNVHVNTVPEAEPVTETSSEHGNREWRDQLAEKDRMLEEKNELLRELQNEVIDLENQLVLTRRILEDKNAEIVLLKGEVVRWQRVAADRETAFKEEIHEKDVQLSELSGVLEIYKDKLGGTTRLVSHSRDQIRSLEQQISAIENDVILKHRHLTAAQDDVARLSRALKLVQRELRVLKQSADSLPSEHRTVQGQIKDLEAQLDEIHGFIEKKLLITIQ